MHFCQLSRNWVLKVDLGTHLRDDHGHLFLWYWELFWPFLIKIGFHAYISNRYLNTIAKLNSKKVNKSAYFQPWFDQPWTTTKIAPNLIKIDVCAYLSNGYINPLSKLNSKKVKKSASFQPWFDQPWTLAKIAPNLIKIGVMLIFQMGT